MGFLLDSYKFFGAVQYSVKSESLVQSGNQISALLGKIVRNKQLLQNFVPVSQYACSSNSGSLECDAGASEREWAVSSVFTRDELALKALLCDVFVSCDPHVVSGMCCFLHHLFLAFPDFVATRCHRNATLVQLIRWDRS